MQLTVVSTLLQAQPVRSRARASRLELPRARNRSYRQPCSLKPPAGGSKTRPGPALARTQGDLRRAQPLTVECRSPGASDASTASPFPAALKEWAPVCSALADGSQTLLLRKGGILDRGFELQHARFALFPTSFHTQADLLQPPARERYSSLIDYEPGEALEVAAWAEVTGAWSTTDPAILAALQPFHIWSSAFLDTRLRWKPEMAITCLELRVHTLAAPLAFASQPDFWGCFSWLDLPRPTAQALQAGMAEGSRPALPGDEFRAKQEHLRAALRASGIRLQELDW